MKGEHNTEEVKQVEILIHFLTFDLETRLQAKVLTKKAARKAIEQAPERKQRMIDGIRQASTRVEIEQLLELFMIENANILSPLCFREPGMQPGSTYSDLVELKVKHRMEVANKYFKMARKKLPTFHLMHPSWRIVRHQREQASRAGLIIELDGELNKFITLH